MSVPQFKETILVRIEEAIQSQVSYLVEQTQADLPSLRLYQGKIAGLRQAQEIMQDHYRESHG